MRCPPTCEYRDGWDEDKGPRDEAVKCLRSVNSCARAERGRLQGCEACSGALDFVDSDEMG
jgi:hypothetical protein